MAYAALGINLIRKLDSISKTGNLHNNEVTSNAADIKIP